MGLTWGFMKRPNTEKHSTDESNDKLNCASCSMQGWRESQEDAHNCLLNYEPDVSYFAVYDGHGGDEVSKYAAEYLPELLKNMDDYKNGNIERALEEAFLQFDATLLTQPVMNKLQKFRQAEQKRLRKQKLREIEEEREEAGKTIQNEEVDNKLVNCEESQHKGTEMDESHLEDNIDNLYEEATMPLDEVLEKYISQDFYEKLAERINEKLKGESSDKAGCSSGSSSSSVPKTRRGIISTSDNNKDIVKCDDKLKTNESKTEIEPVDGEVLVKENLSPENSECVKQDKTANGLVKSTQDLDSSKLDTPNCTTVHENGEVKRGKGKASRKTKGVEPDPLETPPIKRKPEENASDLYKSFLVEELSEEESEDEFCQLPSDDNSDDSEEQNDNTDEEDDNNVEHGKDAHNESDTESSDEEEEDEIDDSEDSMSADGEEGADDNKTITKNLIKVKKTGPASKTGCTAVVALLKGTDLYVANAGDSRCVLCRKGKAIDMSLDHKPEDKREETRIRKAGGKVDDEGRVNGGPNLSRAFGDHAFKSNMKYSDREQMITAFPDVRKITINPEEDEFLLLACDGIWDCMSSQEAIDFVRSRLIEGNDKLSLILEEMFNNNVRDEPMVSSVGSDNMTAVLVQFKSSTTSETNTSAPKQDLNL